MSYKVGASSSIRRRIVAWNLPDSVFVEIWLRLEQLGDEPARHLQPLPGAYKGMAYRFSMVDPTNRLREFFFEFQIVYGQDEETLSVVNCAYAVFGL